MITDVTAPLLGPSGAAAVFGPQKGVVPSRIAAHEARLARLAALLPSVDADAPGAGAAGGAGFGLMAWGARLVPGSSAVAAALGMTARVSSADLVLTGEGRFDSQTAAGKVPAHLLSLARAHGARALLVAGAIEAPTTGFDGAVSLTELAGSPAAAMASTLPLLREAGARLAREVSVSAGGARLRS
ncbi:glycerate kinase [Frondihabitans sp. PAMC 28766]|uniref:glycerate kinase n=1 Tax=Frondihabitans sp. PAMC 28766 TaxID=1795630 RepID=UPI000A9627F7